MNKPNNNDVDTTTNEELPFTGGLPDRDQAYEEWVDDCERNARAAADAAAGAALGAFPPATAAPAAAAVAPQANETRVGVSGRRFTAEARLAGGKWVRAGTHATEAAAWAAANAKLADLKAKAARAASRVA